MFKALNGGVQAAFVIMSMIAISEATHDFADAAEEYKNAGGPGLPALAARSKMQSAMTTIVQNTDPLGVTFAIIRQLLDNKFMEAVAGMIH